MKKLGHVIATAKLVRIVLDDSPTKRYGRKIEGADYHHNPTPGRTNAKTCFGHSWVVEVLVVTHPALGEISFPIAAELYLRQKEIDKLHEDRRNFLRHGILANEFNAALNGTFIPKKITQVLERLLKLST